MQELRYTNIEEIKVDSPLIKKIMFKPKVAPIVCAVAGLGLCIIANLWTRILGVFFIFMAIFVYKFVEDKKVMDVYEKGAVVYKTNDEKLAVYIDYDLVKEWKIEKNTGHDTIYFIFEGGYKFPVETFQTEKAYNALDKVIHDKEERVIQREKNKKMKWANPVETLKAWAQRITKKK